MRWRLQPRFGWGAAPRRRSSAVPAPPRSATATSSSWCAAGTRASPSHGEAVSRPTSSPRRAPRRCSCSPPTTTSPGCCPSARTIENRLEETCEYWRRWLQGGQLRGALEGGGRAQRAGAGDARPRPQRRDDGGRRRPRCRRRSAASATSTTATAGFATRPSRCEAIQQFGRVDQVHATLTWLLRVIDSTNPNLQPFYGIDGQPAHRPARARRSPATAARARCAAGNDAGEQLQLGNYGDLLEAAAMFVAGGHSLGPAAAHRLDDARSTSSDRGLGRARRPHLGAARLASSTRRASSPPGWPSTARSLLAEQGELARRAPSGSATGARSARRPPPTSTSTAGRSRGSTYTRAAGDASELDAGTLLMARAASSRAGRSGCAARSRRSRPSSAPAAPLLYRYSGQQDEEGAFVACSFWMVEALAAVGERERGRSDDGRDGRRTPAISGCSRRRSILPAASSSATCRRRSATWP